MLIQRLKHLAIALLLLTVGSLVLVPAIASADSKADACAGLKQLDSSASCSGNSAGSINKILRWVINILSIIVGFIAVVMVIVGGLRLIMSGGDSNNTASARNTILYALIGLVIVALAQILVHFVLSKTTGAIK